MENINKSLENPYYQIVKKCESAGFSGFAHCMSEKTRGEEACLTLGKFAMILCFQEELSLKNKVESKKSKGHK